jgi:phospholipid/cholesterol/gamma-HCH transport system substrate-binding protein
MPAAKKVAWSQLKVGLMAMIALALLAVLIFLLTGAENPFSDKATLYTYLADSAAMTEGSGVRLNGILIGKVRQIELSGDPDLNRTIRMTIQVESQILSQIPEDSIVGFSAENVLGAKFLNIKKGESKTPIKNGGELKARDDKDFLEVVQSAMPLLESVQSILKRIDGIVAQVEAGKGSIGKLVFDEDLYRRAESMVTNADRVTAALAEGKGTLGALLYERAMYDDIRQSLAKLDTIVEGLQRGEGTAGKLLKDPALYDELRNTTKELRLLAADLNAGKGTAGKLLKDEALHNRLVATIDRLNGTMDKLNEGQGTLGQLMVNPALYEQMAGLTTDLRGFMKDFRANPKKFLTIQLKLF